MAYRCILGHHGPCEVCNARVTPTNKGHIHAFRRSTGAVECLCGICYGDILCAANLILKAIKAADLHYETPEELGAILRESVIVSVQQNLGLGLDRAN